MRKNRLWDLMPMLILWLAFSVIWWGFVFTRITTYPPEEKMALYVDGEVTAEKDLAAFLYRHGTDGIRAVQVRPFSYAMFGGDELRDADLFIIPRENLELYRECLAPWPEGMEKNGDFYAWDGVDYGMKVYDAHTGEGVAQVFIAYENDLYLPQDYYLFFGNRSSHLEDGLAEEYARMLLSID